MIRPRQKQLQSLFLVNENNKEYDYRSRGADGSIIQQVDDALFIWNENEVEMRKSGEKPYKQSYKNAQEAFYEMRSWIRSYKRGDF